MKSNDEINRKIAQFMGLCWHDPQLYIGSKVGLKNICDKCKTTSPTPNPDYCSDDSPRRLLNEAVAKLPVDAHEKFERALLDELGGLDYLEAWIAYAIATPEMIARAIVACIEVGEEQPK